MNSVFSVTVLSFLLTPLFSFAFQFDPNESASNGSSYVGVNRNIETVKVEKKTKKNEDSLFQMMSSIYQKAKKGKSSIEQGGVVIAGGLCRIDFENKKASLSAPIVINNFLESVDIKLITPDVTLAQPSSGVKRYNQSRILVGSSCGKNDPMYLVENISIDQSHSYIFVDQYYECEKSGSIKNSRQSIHCFYN